jgi:hypothetical protein
LPRESYTFVLALAPWWLPEPESQMNHIISNDKDTKMTKFQKNKHPKYVKKNVGQFEVRSDTPYLHKKLCFTIQGCLA